MNTTSLVALVMGATFALPGDPARAQLAITTIDAPDATATLALGINSRGDVVGNYFVAAASHGFLLSDGAFTTIDFPGATETQAVGINDRGQIVGHYLAGGAFHGFVLD